jgi:DNA-binding LytR/AlgR family response regulator
MKITIEEIKNLTETEIIIKCKERDESVENVISTLRLFDMNVIVKKDDVKYILSPSDIYYFDSVDDKVFCYTNDNVYETTNRLYEIEEIFKNSTFLRVNKNQILNVNMINFFIIS